MERKDGSGNLLSIPANLNFLACGKRFYARRRVCTLHNIGGKIDRQGGAVVGNTEMKMKKPLNTSHR
jgi:hypothetical protein